MDKGEQVYKLISVMDSNGNRKDDVKFYKDRIGSIAKNIKTCDRDNETKIVKADFIQNSEGRLIQLGLRTSTIKEIREDENKIHIHTRNSIYNFEKVELQEECYQDAANLIELYFTDQGDKFCKGYFYDEHSQPHVLVKYVHLGMFVDTVLIKVKDTVTFSKYICRYYVKNRNIIEFYGTIYHQQPYVTEILIHNQCSFDSLMTAYGRSRQENQNWGCHEFREPLYRKSENHLGMGWALMSRLSFFISAMS